MEKQIRFSEMDRTIFSRMIYSWVTPLVKVGDTKILEEDDVHHVDIEYEAKTLNDRFNKAWNPKAPNPSLLRAFGILYWKYFLVSGLLKLFYDMVKVITPVLLGMLLKVMEEQQTVELSQYSLMLSFSILVLVISSSLAHHYHLHLVGQCGLALRTALSAEIYHKAFRLSHKSRDQFSPGTIVNLVSNDTYRLEDLVLHMHQVWAEPFQILIVILVLVQSLGFSALLGFSILAITIPCQTTITAHLGRYREEAAAITDSRIRMLKELLAGIRIIKFYAWEHAFVSQLEKLRRLELGLLVRTDVLKALNGSVSVIISVVASITTFSLHIWFGNPLTADIIFPSMALFNSLRLPLVLFPRAVVRMFEGHVSLKRVEDFLLAPELDYRPLELKESGHSVVVENGEFDWDSLPVSEPTNHKFPKLWKQFFKRGKRRPGRPRVASNSDESSIRGINLRIEKGMLVGIIGPVGSGKSSLISSLLGEMKHVDGQVLVDGKMEYCPQQPWIQNVSLRENIVFGRTFDQQKYQNTIRMCHLDRDIAKLVDGDLTEIGEQGTTLSGGQKQRIGLARAIYGNPDILLLDDPLSAIDSRVEKYIFDHCICGPKLKDQTRIIATHQLQFMPRFDWIVVMHNGQIECQGTFDQLVNTNPPFKHLASKYCLGSQSAPGDDGEPEIEVLGQPEPKPTVWKLMSIEERNTGAISRRVYGEYIKECGGVVPVMGTLGCLVASHGLKIGVDWWISSWAENRVGLTDAQYLMIYIMLGSLRICTDLVRSVLISFSCIRATRRLCSRALDRIVHAPLGFFDSTPSGRILNRFNRDMYLADVLLPDSIRVATNSIVVVLTTLVLVACMVPMLMVPIGMFLIFAHRIQRVYRKSSREINRMEAISRSPVCAHFAETLNGLATLRASRATTRFVHRNQNLLNDNNRFAYVQLGLRRWVGIRLHVVSGFLVFFGMVFFLWSRTSPAVFGLAAGYLFELSFNSTVAVRELTDAEAQMNSIERILHYARDLPSESRRETDDQGVVRGWPSHGRIQFENVTVAYQEGLPPVLSSFNLDVNPGERVGIVGRTGSGKSTVLLALFRLVNTTLGRILIDNVDTMRVGLRDLRSGLAIIPQVPLMFEGTVRFNLDPLNKCSDSEIWEALERTQLKSLVSGLCGKLEAKVAENGENFSVGQRQLFCLARAILKRTKILVLDEATASMDLETERLVQESLGKDFVNVTVISIAHRLDTIMEYDRILVLDSGQMVEIDTPDRLLQNPDSYFRRLVDYTKGL